MVKINRNRELKRKLRVRSAIFGLKEKPRMAVYRSNRYIYLQAIDDQNKTTLAAYSSFQLQKEKNYQKSNKTEQAKKVGFELARRLKGKNIKKGVFDRNIYHYNGRVKAVAEGLRNGGIEI